MRGQQCPAADRMPSRKFDLLVVCVRSSVGVVLFGWGVPELKSPARFWRGCSAEFSPAMTPSPHW
jgi:hypothetical protein